MYKSCRCLKKLVGLGGGVGKWKQRFGKVIGKAAYVTSVWNKLFKQLTNQKGMEEMELWHVVLYFHFPMHVMQIKGQ